MSSAPPPVLTQISTFRQLDYEPDLGVFELAGVLPEGSVFPYDFGFIPSTPNHRLLAVGTRAHTHSDVNALQDLRPGMVDEIEHFFTSYNETKGKQIRNKEARFKNECLRCRRDRCSRLRRRFLELQTKVHLYHGKHSDDHAVLRRWVEAPLPHRLDGIVVQSEVIPRGTGESTLHFDVSGHSVLTHDDPQENRSFYPRF